MVLLAQEDSHDDSSQTAQAARGTQGTNDYEIKGYNSDSLSLKSAEEDHSLTGQEKTSLFAPFGDFSNLHPLVVTLIQ